MPTDDPGRQGNRTPPLPEVVGRAARGRGAAEPGRGEEPLAARPQRVEQVAVVPVLSRPVQPRPDMPDGLEILSGVSAGDRLLLP